MPLGSGLRFSSLQSVLLFLLLLFLFIETVEPFIGRLAFSIAHPFNHFLGALVYCRGGLCLLLDRLSILPVLLLLFEEFVLVFQELIHRSLRLSISSHHLRLEGALIQVFIFNII
mmetsp:Transcript_17003/g.16226  ORF Transcript_17003/g.16226 Transcript_17003/m.16226 type:complete len:115 (+) Transcript_17003:1231-1575(+)